MILTRQLLYVRQISEICYVLKISSNRKLKIYNVRAYYFVTSAREVISYGPQFGPLKILMGLF